MGKVWEVLSGPVSSLVGQIGGVVDELSTSDEERLAAKLRLAEVEAEFHRAILDSEKDIAEAQADVLKTEIASRNWLASNWRPILMLTFTYIILHAFVLAPVFGIATVVIPDQMWNLLTIGVGGYIGGRTVEKITPAWADSLKKR